MPFLNIWIHLVWSTKKRNPLLIKRIRPYVFHHIRKNAKEKNIHIDFVNGHNDHVHCLVSLNNNQAISEVVQLIKAESAFWINESRLCPEKFEWQDEYFAISVSEAGINAVREYIKNQEMHHAAKTFQEEYDELITGRCRFELMSHPPALENTYL